MRHGLESAPFFCPERSLVLVRLLKDELRARDGVSSMIRLASDLLNRKEFAVVIYTNGDKLHKTGKGFSGNWVINPNHRLEKVIIYYRKDNRKSGAELYVGDFQKIGTPLEPDTQKNLETRHAVYFTNLKPVGETEVNFHQFTETKRNSFCFKNKKEQ
jgi:hypothetical protein